MGVLLNKSTYIVPYPPLKTIKSKNNYEEDSKMNIDEKLDIIRKCIDMGANVQMNFHFIKGKDKAEKIAAELGKVVGTHYEHIRGNGSNWFTIYTDVIRITVFYEKTKEDTKAELLRQIAELEKEEEQTV